MSMPARSTTSQAVSRTMRCCGSMAMASRGEIPKKSASKRGTSYTNPPSREYDLSGSSSSLKNRPSKSHPRSSGNADRASVPDDTMRHRSSGLRTSPGKRQLMAVMAMGSCALASVSCSLSRVSLRSAVTRLRK